MIKFWLSNGTNIEEWSVGSPKIPRGMQDYVNHLKLEDWKSDLRHLMVGSKIGIKHGK